MYIKEYKIIKPSKKVDGIMTIPELDRYKPSVFQFLRLANLDLKLTVPTAFIFVDGFSIIQSEAGIGTDGEDSLIIKSGTSYAVHRWIHTIKNKELLTSVDIVSSTCASSMKAIHLANEKLKNELCEEVIVIGYERITKAIKKTFNKLVPEITCGDGFVYTRFTKVKTKYAVEDTKFMYSYNQNPFYFDKITLNKLIPLYEVDNVKLHGTGTPSNTEAEEDLAKIGKPIIYKKDIGHTQGISTLLELCMLLDNNVKGTTLVVASGFGGFYGSCTLWS